MATFKMTDDMLEALRVHVYGRYSVRHDYTMLDDGDMRRSESCSFEYSDKCPTGKAIAVRDGRLYCPTCHARTSRERSRIVARQAAPALARAVAACTTKRAYDAAMTARKW